MTAPPPNEAVTVVVIDNHEAVLWGVGAALEGAEGMFQVTGRFSDVESFLNSGIAAPAVIVLDLYLGRDDVPATPYIEQLSAKSAVVLHTAEEKPVPLRQAVAAGAFGLALKNDGMLALREIILDAARGEFACTSVLAGALLEDPDRTAALTPREVDVLIALDDGLTRRQTARKLGIEEETVKTHLKSIRDKFLQAGRDITNSTSIVREAVRDGWIS